MVNDVARFAFVLIPMEPLFSMIIRASKEITDRYHNDNIIDAHQFPPHISLHICTIQMNAVEDLQHNLTKAAENDVTFPMIETGTVTRGSAGYVGLNVRRTPQLMAAHERVIEAAAVARQGMDEEPRPQRRSRPPHQNDWLKTYGNAFVLDGFEPHFSIAKVRQDDQEAAYQIASELVGCASSVMPSAFQVCDIGMQNERWRPILDLEPVSRLPD